MADDDLISGEDAKLRKARWEKLSTRLADDWYLTGYDKNRHLAGIHADGERDIMKQFYEAEKFGQRPWTLARYFTILEITEMRKALHAL